MGRNCRRCVVGNPGAWRVDAEENAPLPLPTMPIKTGGSSCAYFFSRHSACASPRHHWLHSAHAQGNAVYLVTYVEMMPSAVAPAAALLKQYRDATFHGRRQPSRRSAAGIGASDPIRMIEAWRDKAAFDAHGQSASTTEFRDKLTADRGGALRRAHQQSAVRRPLRTASSQRFPLRFMSSPTSTSFRRAKTTAWRRSRP